MTQAADGSWYAWAPPFPPFAPATAAGHAATPPNAPTNGAGTAQRREKRPWTLPPPPGPTLRQRVEQRERERGLRCDDVSCGLGPSDEDPEPPNSNEKRVGIRPLGEHGTRACPHVFHGACLVSAERVAGWGQEDSEEKEEKEGMVEVSCPVCRAVGAVPREDWEAGVRALE
ncbi:hypothetical protein BV25DRAFT_1813794 [Artomyces pyxidatus]|uniref:Uncharacterized protein n=1 Tax=Artomyces pyxidatus TaxID=48021 RepID=A0ACB8SJC8_9AGAM|nr:hypothetical protein BV25DRAFT_1813794 [Artomyces pyxidatus]